MLDLFRHHKRAVLILLLLFVLPGLGFVGIQGVYGFFDNSANVASVNGRKISRQEYDAAIRDYLDRLHQLLGASFDGKMFDTPQMRQALLNQMIQQRVLADEIRRLNLTASDAAVRRALLDIPAIAALRKTDGSIDTDQYQRLLAAQGLTADQLEAQIRAALAHQQLIDSIQASAFAPKALAEQLAAIFDQKRKVRKLNFDPSDYVSKVQLTETQLKQYYESHQQDFMRPESATIEYLTLDIPSLASAIQPSEADLQKYYQDHLARYQAAEQRHASHILITVAPKASAAQHAQAKAKAEALVAELRQHPDQFTQIAKQNSQDSGSAEKGGDLGYFSRGMMVKPFEDAAFKLKVGEISDPVESQFGYHIIKITDIKPTATRSFAEVKDSLIAEVKNQLAAKQFASDADAFSNLVYEQSNSLQPAADRYRLPLQTAMVARQPNPALPPDHPLNQPKFLAAVFADDSLKAKHNTAAIDVGNNTLIAARVTRYQPAAVQPFSAVKAQLRHKLARERATELAAQAGKAKLAVLKQRHDLAGFSPTLEISRTAAQGMSPNAVDAIFKADARQLPKYIGVEQGAGGYTIYRLEAIDTPPIDAKQLAAVQQQLSTGMGENELNAYLKSLQARARVKIYSTSAASG